MNLPRTSGVQLHLTSLPEGRLGDGAYRFVDWLHDAGQTWWQMLPLGPPDRARSPYKASSAFANWRGLLADPRARVSLDEEDAFRTREAFWIDGWAAVAGGRRAVLDQVRFEREWTALRAYATSAGVRLIGDVPIYVAPGGADQRTWPWLFQEGVQAGVPPDAYSDTGQLWGNPLYDWPRLRRTGYRWWVERLRRTFGHFDLARLDHFRGLVAYWSVPAGARDARGGRWRRGPGRAVLDAARSELGRLPLIAEDLGIITPAVERLRDSLALPGMLVLQFGFDPEDPLGPHRMENHRRRAIVYTATHDSDTLRGWYETLPGEIRRDVDAATATAGFDDREPWWRLVRLCASSPAQVSMVQAQDVLGLGSEGRMNVPGRATGSWRWRMAAGALTPALGRRLREVGEEAGRLP
ncbi:4-alpha-glucanotransferase [Capillimicrobium parvum]|uniref:4-alpha-glucanotransferase n=1 Tax=Capillimicrobium parvum TaxID=2884022 RepID=A0A9E6Y0T4_9ACTN|nr:4-alpha-glucanotransferase [Capillimicrobium parvum]UGS37568.1 4-alpha-glucanotransferase [Capillimicrobium parvum]